MAQDNELSITIKATDLANKDLKTLQQEIKGLQRTINEFSKEAANRGGVMGGASRQIVAGLQQEIAAINQEISVRKNLTTVIEANTKARLAELVKINASVLGTEQEIKAIERLIEIKTKNEATKGGGGGRLNTISADKLDAENARLGKIAEAARLREEKSLLKAEQQRVITQIAVRQQGEAAAAKAQQEAYQKRVAEARANANEILRVEQEAALKRQDYITRTFRPQSNETTQQIINRNVGLTSGNGRGGGSGGGGGTGSEGERYVPLSANQFNRQILSAPQSTRVLYSSLSANAEEDDRRRQAEAAAKAQAERVAQINREANEIARVEKEARDKINTARTAAIYENNDRNLAAKAQQNRFDEDYRNAIKENSLRDAEAIAKANAVKKAAEEYAKSPAGIIGSGANVEVARARGIAEANAAGATAAEALAAGEKAVTDALATQARAWEAVKIAMDAAKAAGKSEAEATASGAAAATESLLAQARMQREANSSSGHSGAIGGRILTFADEIERGQKGQIFATLGRTLKDVGVGAVGASAGIAGLIAIIGSEKIINAATAMGKWATEIKAGAAATGLSVQQYSALYESFVQLGLKGDEADTTLRHLGETLNTALVNPSSLAAEAFHNLGISQEMLVKNGSDVAGAFGLLANAYERTINDANKTANLNEILGRGFEKIIPALDHGKSGFDNLTNSMQATGRVIDEETANKLEKMGEDIRKVGENINSGAIPAFVAWGPVIVNIVQTIGAAIVNIEGFIAKIGELVAKSAQINTKSFIPNPDAPFGASAYDLVPGSRSIAEKDEADRNALQAPEQLGPGRVKTKAAGLELALTVEEKLRDKITKDEADIAESYAKSAKTGAASSELKRNAEMAAQRAIIADIQRTLDTEQLTSTQRAQISAELNEHRKALANESMSADIAATKAGTAAAKQSYRDFAAGEQEKIAAADGVKSKVLAIYTEWANAAKNIYKQNASVYEEIEKQKINASNRFALEDAKNQIDQQIEQRKLEPLQRTLSAMQAGTYNYNKKEESPDAIRAQAPIYRQEAQQTIASGQAGDAIIQNQLANAIPDSKEAISLQKELAQNQLQYTTEAIELYKKAGAAEVAAAQKAAAPYVAFFDSVGSQFESFSGSILNALVDPQRQLVKAGLTTIKTSLQGNEIRQAFANLFKGVAEDAAKQLETGLSHALASALSGGATNSIGTLLGNLLQKSVSSLFGQSAGNAVGSIVGNTAGQAAGSATSAAALTTAATTLGTSAATLGSGGVGLNAAAAALTAGATGLTADAAGLTAAVAGLSTAAIALNTAAISLQVAAVVMKVPGFSAGGIVPSAAGGMVVGGVGGTLAILHEKEMVLPRPISEGVQNMISRGGATGGGAANNNSTTNNNLSYSPTINTGSRGRNGSGMSRSEFSQMMSMHSGAMLGEAKNMMRGGWRPA